MEKVEIMGDRFPAVTPDSDEMFPRMWERLGLVLKDGTRLAVCLDATDDPYNLVGIGIRSGLRTAIPYTEIDLIIFFDRPKH